MYQNVEVTTLKHEGCSNTIQFHVHVHQIDMRM